MLLHEKMTSLPSIDDFPGLFAPPVECIERGFNIDPDEQGEYKATRLLYLSEPRKTVNLCQFYTEEKIYEQLNDLRHKYAAVDEKKSMGFLNRILFGFFWDDYMLNILADWHLDKDEGMALRALLDKAERFPQFYQVRSTCLIRAAQIYEKHGDTKQASRLYLAFFDPHPTGTNEYNFLKYVGKIESGRSDLFEVLAPATEDSLLRVSTDLSPGQVAFVSRALQKNGIQPTEKLLQLFSCAICLRPTGLESQVGSSRLGGLPDVPPEWEWPAQLEFLAQFNLEEIAPLDASGLLPKRGLLQIFAQSVGHWKDRNGYKIFLYEGDLSMLQPATPPASFRILKTMASRWGFSLWAPRWGSNAPKLNVCDRTEGGGSDISVYCPVPVAPFRVITSNAAYFSCLEEERDAEVEKALIALNPDLCRLGRYVGWDHQILGSPNMDGDAAIEVWESETGLNYYQSQAADTLPYKHDKPEWDQWVLLFQMDSCDEVGTQFSDAGMYFFMIRKEDLAARRFDRIYFSMSSD